MPETELLFPEIEALSQKVEKTLLPPELKEKLTRMIDGLRRMAQFRTYTAEYESISRYVDLVIELPWEKRTADNLDLQQAREILDKNHYGMESVKERILEHVAVLNLTAKQRGTKAETVTGPLASTRASVLCFVGLPGVGKTSVAYSIAEALHRKFVRVAMGGMGSADQLRGRARSFPQAEPGQIIKGVLRAGSKNPVILLDELDRVAEDAQTEVMGVLLELLDPEQNSEFYDHYLDYPFDLSEVLFICSANHTRNVANAVMDRLEEIAMPAYSDKEKEVIVRDYLLPRAMKACGLTTEQLVIHEDLWPQIVRPLGYDAGIRTLERTVQGICRKVAKRVVEGQTKQVKLTESNIGEYLPKW